MKKISVAVLTIVLTITVIAGCKKAQVKKPAASVKAAITAFKIDSGVLKDAQVTINPDSATITINVNFNPSTITFSPTITVSPGATVSPSSSTKVTFTENGQVIYTVTSSLGEVQKWYVSIKNTLPSPVVYKDTTVTNFFRRETGHIASDGGQTIKLDNGKVIWMMGDSHINDYRASDGTMGWLFQVRNAGLLQPINDWKWQNTQTLVGNSTSVPSYIKFTEDNNHWVWPGGGIQLGDTLYVYCGNLTNVSGGFGFGSGGNDMLAKIKVPEMTVHGYVQLQDFNGIDFGNAYAKSADGYVYVYGIKNGFIVTNFYLARFPANNPYAKWTFFDGKGWNTDPKTAKGLGQGMSAGASIAYINGKYIIVSTEFSVGCNQGNRIYIATSDSPVGPFSAQRAIYRITDTVQNDYPFFYAAAIHPEYVNNKGEILVTYAINGYPNCLPDHDANYRSIPDRYRLKAIRIPWSIVATDYAIK